jgi:hypothetical protein
LYEADEVVSDDIRALGDMSLFCAGRGSCRPEKLEDDEAANEVNEEDDDRGEEEPEADDDSDTEDDDRRSSLLWDLFASSCASSDAMINSGWVAINGRDSGDGASVVLLRLPKDRSTSATRRVCADSVANDGRRWGRGVPSMGKVWEGIASKDMVFNRSDNGNNVSNGVDDRGMVCNMYAGWKGRKKEGAGCTG